MSSLHRPLDARAMAIMSLLCLIWGFQQIALKATAADMAPTLQIGLRSGLAALLVLGWMRWRGERLHWREGQWRAGALVGGLFGLEFMLVGEGLRHTSAAHMAVFLYTAPVFAALGLAWVQRSERLHPLQWAGVALAFAGMALAFLGRGGAVNSQVLWGDLLGLLGGAAWGATTVAVRASRLATAAPAETLFYQLSGGFVLLLLTALLLGQTAVQPSARLAASLAFQTVIVSFISYGVWFWLLRQYLASRLGVFSFLTPLFGVGFGVWLLGEALEPAFLGGAALVLLGITVVSAQPLLMRRVPAS
ncbi:DMT family transporter [Inhella sp.]|uniref:DMT family transporter n=1 Tax=Inhella sp. TaxID=1921806 RepID=UPI0035AFBEFC